MVMSIISAVLCIPLVLFPSLFVDGAQYSNQGELLGKSHSTSVFNRLSYRARLKEKIKLFLNDSFINTMYCTSNLNFILDLIHENVEQSSKENPSVIFSQTFVT